MMRFDRFTERAQEAAARAAELAQKYGHTQVDVEHVLLALLEQTDGVVLQILEHVGVTVDALRRRIEDVLRTGPKTSIYGSGGTGQVFVTPRLKRVLDLAIEEASKLKDEYISTEHILLAMAADRNSVTARLLAESGVTKDRIYEAIKEVRGGQHVTTPQAESRYRVLEKYSRDLTKLAKEGKLDPVIGRDDEILRVIQVLSRRTKNNPVLIGEAGRGQDRHRRRAGAKDRRERRAGNPDGQARRRARPGRDGGRVALPGRVRGAAQGGDGRDPAERGRDHPVH